MADAENMLSYGMRLVTKVPAMTAIAVRKMCRTIVVSVNIVNVRLNPRLGDA